MSLLEELQRIMDMPNPTDEADKKLTKCYMVVNGEIKYVYSYLHDKGGLSFYDRATDKKHAIVVKTLDVFLPESGIYKCEDTYIQVVKKPVRQWQRSMSENFYTVQDLLTGNGRMDSVVLTKIFKGKKVDVWVSSEANIYYKNSRIGFIKDEDTLICENKHFKQELLDWSRNV